MRVQQKKRRQIPNKSSDILLNVRLGALKPVGTIKRHRSKGLLLCEGVHGRVSVELLT